MRISEIILLVWAIVMTGAVILLLYLVFTQTARWMNHLESIRRNGWEHQDRLLDRLMAVDFTTYKQWQATDQAELGSFEVPDPFPLSPGVEAEATKAASNILERLRADR